MEHSLAMVSCYFVGESTMAEALRTVCDAALAAVEPAVMVGLATSVGTRQGAHTFTHVCTHADLLAVEKTQFESEGGPCWDAFRTGHTVYWQATEAGGRYAEFRAAAARDHIHSVLSVPLGFGIRTIGALTLYAERDDAFGDRVIELLEGLAAQAASLLTNTDAYWEARRLSENLTQAMESRAEIEQAKGIIMATTGVDADEAYEELRRQSQYEKVKIRVIATELVRRSQSHRRRPIGEPSPMA